MPAHRAGKTTRFATNWPTALAQVKGTVALAQAKGTIERATPVRLFVCEQNTDRFMMAAMATNVPSDGAVHVRSACSAPAHVLDRSVVAVTGEPGSDLREAFTKPLG